MHSELLIEYMRTGNIPPLAKGDTKRQVEAKLGPPDDWKGQLPDITWSGPPLDDFHDSWAWHYGAVCVCFRRDGLEDLAGIRLDFGFLDPSAPIRFPALFAGLPQTHFTLRELLDLMDEHAVQHKHYRAGPWVSEGNIGILTSDSEYSPNASVVLLSPQPYIQVEETRNRVRQRLIGSFSELLLHPDLASADRLKCEECLRDLEAQNELSSNEPEPPI